LTPNGIRWTRYCVTTSATALFAVSGAVTAFASRQYTFQHGDTLSSIARTFHVSISDLERANHLDRYDSIRDGRRLIIPNPPKRLALEAAMHHSSRTKGDRLSLRLGPGSDYRRVAFVDDGVPLTVTAAKDGWFQVELDNGRTGWLRQDFVAHTPHLQHEGTAIVARGDAHRHTGRAAARHAEHTVKVAHQASKHSDRLAHNAHTATKHHDTVAHSGHAATKHDRIVAHSGHDRSMHAAHHHDKAIASARTERGEGRHRRLHTATAASTHKTGAHAVHLAANAHHHSGHHERIAGTHGATHAIAAHHTRRHNVEVARRSSDREDDIVRTAYAYRGTPYVYGGEGRGGFDCSGFTSYLYSRKGVSLPHSARGQFAMGQHVDRGHMKPGDLVFFHTVTPGISHVGMYVGNGRFVHASSRRSGGVRVDNLDSGYYSSAFRGARRMK
jgi:cell wall-associated NlpC family hydrolase